MDAERDAREIVQEITSSPAHRTATPDGHHAVALDDKYARFDGRVFLTGIQSLVRLPLLQRRRDRAAGHRTAGFISGYRGSARSAVTTSRFVGGEKTPRRA